MQGWGVAPVIGWRGLGGEDRDIHGLAGHTEKFSCFFLLLMHNLEIAG